jgi:FMN phosphatase YigB (HAD superfamily)
MIIRAVLCDIYNTLLDVGPPPADAGQRWDALCGAALPEAPRLTLAEFDSSAEVVIRREHAAAKAAGISYPEIFWPAVAGEAWPALTSLNAPTLDDFLFEHAQLQHSVRLVPNAAEGLRLLAKRKVCLGLVSNAQPYTLRQLDAGLRAAGLSRALFVPDLCFFSFEHGFSKPDPQVFRLLTARLAQRGIPSGEALVIGDRQDNDIDPAQAHGFQTWRLAPAGEPKTRNGDWLRLSEVLEVSCPSAASASLGPTQAGAAAAGSEPGASPPPGV